MSVTAFPKYDEYQESNIPWIGNIPSHWQHTSIRAVTELKSEKNQPDLPVLSVYREFGVILKDSRDDNHNVTSSDTSNYKAVQKGDLVVNKMKAWQGSMGVSEHEGIVSPAYITCRIKQDKILPKYLHYLLRSKPYIGVYNSISYGVRVGQWDMHYEDFKKVAIVEPPMGEMKRIVSFIDEKTAEIDTAIAKKQQLIQLLNEQKAILINRAVTKGLNPDIKMKDSGVPWIGKIPEHWSFTSFKHCCSIIKDGLHHTPQKYDKGINFISTQHVRNRRIAIENATYISKRDFEIGHPRVKPEVGDVLITLVGSIGFSAVVRKEHFPLSFTRHVGYVRLRENIMNAEYLVNYTESHAFNCFIDKNVSKTAQPSIYLSSLASHKLPVPPENERQQICDWLKLELLPFRDSISLIEREIQTLKELKQVLITSATTGKIKV